MPVTIKDIARVAGVSHTTVSRALKDHPTISRETTQRIQALAQQMGYIPSAVAQSLLSRQTWTIGMVITTIADPFVVKVVEGVEQVAQAAKYSVFLATSHNNPEQEVAVVETLHRRRVDAIIVASSRVGSLYSSQLDRIQVPIVLINNNAEGEYLHSVAVDDAQGAALALQHLVSLGHRRIGYVGVNNRPKLNRRRLAGYRQALAQAGLAVDPTLIIYPDRETDLECGQIGLQKLLDAQATAVCCFNDVVAIGLLMACREQQISVPEQLSVVGFDNIEPATYVAPPLTTVAQPLLVLGQRAMEMTLHLIAGHKVQDQRLSCQLVVRQSTAPV
ncbi:MAG: LacI family transcriptional regulator [Chloroflexales bacterium]|nr:LacI family transcriptional regulator [Chloroflexales bacterium]